MVFYEFFISFVMDLYQFGAWLITALPLLDNLLTILSIVFGFFVYLYKWYGSSATELKEATTIPSIKKKLVVSKIWTNLTHSKKPSPILSKRYYLFSTLI